MQEQVILVDTQNNELGSSEKIRAHQLGLCHRAFSIFIFYQNHDEWELLLQKRHPNKYHSGGLWTNTTCGHPRPGENIIHAGQRRLQEEMGIETTLTLVGHFHYIAHFDNGLTENEFDHVLIGFTQKKDVPFNQTEAIAIEWKSIVLLSESLKQHPQQYSPWFNQALEIAQNHLPRTTN